MKNNNFASIMSKKQFLIIAIFILGFYNGFSQTVRIDEATQKAYITVDVPKTYERIIAKGYESVELFDYLGNYYYKVNNIEKSITYFDMLFSKFHISNISKASIDIYNKIKELQKARNYVSDVD